MKDLDNLLIGDSLPDFKGFRRFRRVDDEDDEHSGYPIHDMDELLDTHAASSEQSGLKPSLTSDARHFRASQLFSFLGLREAGR